MSYIILICTRLLKLVIFWRSIWLYALPPRTSWKIPLSMSLIFMQNRLICLLSEKSPSITRPMKENRRHAYPVNSTSPKRLGCHKP